MSHTECFLEPSTYLEQVGFFAAMLGLGGGKPWRYFRDRGGDRDLWTELQYVFSDMNCWCTHLLAYLKAKWMLSCEARGLGDSFGARWSDLLRDIGMDSDSESCRGAWEAAEATCSRKLSAADGDALREFFRRRAPPFAVELHGRLAEE